MYNSKLCISVCVCGNWVWNQINSIGSTLKYSFWCGKRPPGELKLLPVPPTTCHRFQQFVWLKHKICYSLCLVRNTTQKSTNFKWIFVGYLYDIKQKIFTWKFIQSHAMWHATRKSLPQTQKQTQQQIHNSPTNCNCNIGLGPMRRRGRQTSNNINNNNNTNNNNRIDYSFYATSV